MKTGGSTRMGFIYYCTANPVKNEKDSLLCSTVDKASIGGSIEKVGGQSYRR